MSGRDYLFGVIGGLLTGILVLPIVRAVAPALSVLQGLGVILLSAALTLAGLVASWHLGKRIAVLRQIGRFGVTGLLAAAIDLGGLTFLIFFMKKYFGIEPGILLFGVIGVFSLYKTVSFLAANVTSYYWNRCWTFSGGTGKANGAEYFKFLLVSGLGLACNVIIASYAFKSVRGVNLSFDQLGLLSGVAGGIAGCIWNFMGYKFLVFKVRGKESIKPAGTGLGLAGERQGRGGC